MYYKGFNKIGGIKDYWHAVGFSKELNKKKYIKLLLYGIPLLIGKDGDNVYAVVDVCPHMKAPLYPSQYNTSQIKCSYHGWNFTKQGNLHNIPSSPHLAGKMKCKLFTLKALEKDGFIYVLPSNSKSINTIPDISLKLGPWKEYCTSMVFETNEELLIENFMDATHTPIVHDKLIREDSAKVAHSLQVQNTNTGVKVNFGEVRESVGGFLSKLFYKKLKISHSDEFILPNIVLVQYHINGKHRFQACISCSPEQEGKTKAYVKLDYNFGLLNYILRWIIPSMAKKILRQDFDITQKQYKNRVYFSDTPDTPIDYDYLHKQVQIIRKKAKNGDNLIGDKKIQHISLNV